MIVPTSFRRLTGVVIGAAMLLLPTALSAQGAAADNAQVSTYLPSAHELSRLSGSGSYLAARHAGNQRDAGAAAAYYRASLRGDPKNPELLERAFLSVLAEGDVEEAVRLADQVVKLDKNDRIARLVIGVHALKQKKYAVAKQNLTQSVRGPITDLDPEAVKNVLMISAYGGFLVAQAAAKLMIARGSGSILFTGASASVKGYPNSSSFAMGKFALRGLAQSLARELQPKNIHVAHFVIDGGIQKDNDPRQNERGPDGMLLPDEIAKTYLFAHRQNRTAWTWEFEVRPWIEKF